MKSRKCNKSSIVYGYSMTLNIPVCNFVFVERDVIQSATTELHIIRFQIYALRAKNVIYRSDIRLKNESLFCCPFPQI